MKNWYLIALALGVTWLFAARDVLAGETTIYVGKHFEVRDHEQPTKYVFSGATRVARVTGSLSTDTRVQRFRLHGGWNLLSLAVSATNVSDLLQQSGVITSARIWNPQTGDYSTVPQVAPAGTILWVNATTNTTLAVTGTYQDPVNRQIPAGATYIAGTGLEAWSPALPPSVAAWSFSPESSLLDSLPTWLARLTGDLSTVNELPSVFPPGRAFYVVSPAPFDLEIPDPALRIRYYHQDHLGSSAVMSDANGALVEETANYPFGIARHEHRVRPIKEPYQFTQKERDRESGLHQFEARFLAGRLSRFISVDPLYANADSPNVNPQKLNLYAYVLSNPLRYIDPTGFGELGYGEDGLTPNYSEIGGHLKGDMERVDWGRVGNVTGGAAIAAAGAGLCGTLVGCVVGGPLIAYGSDKISTGIVGADETLTEQYLGKDFAEGMDLISFAAGGAAMAQSMLRGTVTQTAKAGSATQSAKSAIDPMADTVRSYRMPTYAPTPAPRAQTLPGLNGNPAAARVANANHRAATVHANWNAAINSSPKSTWTQATIDATRDYRYSLPSVREQSDALRSIYEAADALFP